MATWQHESVHSGNTQNDVYGGAVVGQGWLGSIAAEKLRRALWE
jgi:hypothetical protein